jgi:hypothetical protein
MFERRNRRLDLAAVADIDLPSACRRALVAAELSGFLDAVGLHIPDRDLYARHREAERDCAANALRRAGDNHSCR